MTRKRLTRGAARQLTLRGFDPRVHAEITRLARREGVSLNKAALLLLRKGAGLEAAKEAPADIVGSTLDHLIGSWSPQEEREFLCAIESMEQIDEALWS